MVSGLSLAMKFAAELPRTNGFGFTIDLRLAYRYRSTGKTDLSGHQSRCLAFHMTQCGLGYLPDRGISKHFEKGGTNT
jgi:hypothetical protein